MGKIMPKLFPRLAAILGNSVSTVILALLPYAHGFAASPKLPASYEGGIFWSQTSNIPGADTPQNRMCIIQRQLVIDKGILTAHLFAVFQVDGQPPCTADDIAKFPPRVYMLSLAKVDQCGNVYLKGTSAKNFVKIFDTRGHHPNPDDRSYCGFSSTEISTREVVDGSLNEESYSRFPLR